MRKGIGLALLGLAVFGASQVGGCGGFLPTIPLPVQLGSNADFDVESGVPSTKTFGTTFSNDSGVAIGSGSIEIDPTAITVTPDQAKTAQGTLPIPETCGDACSTANVSSELCNSVCNLGQVVVTVWVGGATDTNPQLTGDEYGPYIVTLDGEASPISVQPNTVQLQQKTIDAINAGAANVTVQVVSPYGGVISLTSIQINAGL